MLISCLIKVKLKDWALKQKFEVHGQKKYLKGTEGKNNHFLFDNLMLTFDKLYYGNVYLRHSQNRF